MEQQTIQPTIQPEIKEQTLPEKLKEDLPTSENIITLEQESEVGEPLLGEFGFDVSDMFDFEMMDLGF